MRAALFAILALGAVAVIDTTPAAARDYAFCLTGQDFAGFGDCKFNSYAQCQVTASGINATCTANPFPGYLDRTATAPSQRRIIR